MIATKEKLALIGIICLIALVLWGIINQPIQDRKEIDAWATKNSYRVIKATQPWFDHGPYWWVDEDDRIWRVEIEDNLEKHRVAYFRFRMWNHDVEWQK